MYEVPPPPIYSRSLFHTNWSLFSRVNSTVSLRVPAKDQLLSSGRIMPARGMACRAVMSPRRMPTPMDLDWGDGGKVGLNGTKLVTVRIRCTPRLCGEHDVNMTIITIP